MSLMCRKHCPMSTTRDYFVILNVNEWMSVQVKSMSYIRVSYRAQTTSLVQEKKKTATKKLAWHVSPSYHPSNTPCLVAMTTVNHHTVCLRTCSHDPAANPVHHLNCRCLKLSICWITCKAVFMYLYWKHPEQVSSRVWLINSCAWFKMATDSLSSREHRQVKCWKMWNSFLDVGDVLLTSVFPVAI